MFKDTVHNAEKRSLDEHYFITSALIKDFTALENRGIEIEGSIGSLFQPYSIFSGDKKVKLMLYKGDELLYSNQQSIVLQRSFLEPPQDGDRVVSMRKAEGYTYMIVSGKLPVPYDQYTMIYVYDMTNAMTTWSKTKNMLFFVGFILSCLLALGLLLLLNRIFQPLTQISKMSRKIAAGAYETRLPVNGRDELSEMAQSFNFMAEEIQRQMTELINGAERKQQFIDNFAHELHTPLTAIYGYAEYLQKAALTEDDRLSAVEYIMAESLRLKALANQLLDLANLKNDHIAWEAQNVAELFQFVRKTLHQKIIDKKMNLQFYSEIDIIYGDAHLLKSLFINLVDNAIKACKTEGKITVRATVEAGQKIVSIEDNGKGMPPEILQQITEPFYRAEKSRNRREGGTGLGLAISKQIALHHHAKLEFTSQPDLGTTVKIIFTNP